MLRDVDASVLGGLAEDLKKGTDTPVDAALIDTSSLEQAMEQAHIIINCTPVGMHPGEQASLVPAGLFRKGQTVFDIVYTPLETKLLSDARARGLQTVSGVEMFINQAALQFEQFTGLKAPAEVMRRVVMEKLGDVTRTP
jgi:shikimate dehydrogenase